jgi:type I restriction enzyme R subunit
MMVIDNEVELTAYRNEKTFEGSAALQTGETKPVYGPGEVGTGRAKEDKKTPLSAIIEIINERFGTNWVEGDKPFLEQIVGDMVQDDKLVEQARVNSKEQFRQVFTYQVMTAFVNRQDRNEKIINEFMSNQEVREMVIDALLDEVYGRVQAHS